MKRTILLTPNIMSSLSISHQGQSFGVEAHSPKSFFIKLYNHPLFLEENEILVESDRGENDLLLQEIKKTLKDDNTFKEPLSFKGIRSLLLRSIEELELSGLTSANLSGLKFPDPQRTKDLKEILKSFFLNRPKGFSYSELLNSLQERVSSGKLDLILSEIELAIPSDCNFSLSGTENYLLNILREKCIQTNKYFSHLPLKEKDDYSCVSVSGVIKDKTAFLNLFLWMKNKNINADQIIIGAFEYDRFAPVLYELSTELNIPVILKRGLLVTNFSFFEKIMSKFKGELSLFEKAFAITGKEEFLEALFKKKALGIKKDLTKYFEKTTSLGNPILLENELIEALSKVRFTTEELGTNSTGITLYPVEELDYLSFENLAILGLEDHNYPPKEKRHPLLDEETKEHLNKHSDLKLPLKSSSIKVDLVERLIQGTKNEVFLTFEAYSLETGKKIIPSPFFNKILKAQNKELTVENIFLLGNVPSGLLEEVNTKNPYQNLSNTETLAKKNTVYTSKVFSPEINDFDYVEAKEKLEKISASSIEAWFSCPYKFALSELKKMDVPVVLEVDKTFWLSPTKRGTILHETYDKMLTPFIEEKSKSLIKYKKFLKTLKNTPHLILNEILATKSDYRSEVPEWVKKEQIDEMHDNLDLFLKEEILWAEENNFYPIFLEKKFGEFKIPFFKGGPILTGTIDRIDTDGEGRYIIWDYKTGNNSLKEGDITLLLKEKGGSKKSMSFHLQHGFYSAVLPFILDKKEKLKEVMAGYFFVDQSERMLANAEDYGKPFENLKKYFIEELNKGVFYKNSKSCSYCDFSPFCLGVPSIREKVLKSPSDQILKIEEFKSDLIEFSKTRAKDE